MDMSAAELAGELEIMATFPEFAGALSMLEEAALGYGDRPGVGARLRVFGTARRAQMHGGAPGATAEAARALAAELRALGGYKVPRCKQEAGWGTCNLPLDADGNCRQHPGSMT
jgi:hypothetical protein